MKKSLVTTSKRLNTVNPDEINVLKDYGLYRYENVEILEYFSGECFILLRNENSLYDFYNKDKISDFEKCFGNYSHPYNSPEYRYYHCTPEKIIIFFHDYLVKCYDFPDEWYRAYQEKNGNLLLEAYAGSLEKIIGTV